MKTVGSLGLLLSLSLGACTPSGNELQVADRSYDEFKDQVFPVLMKHCAFHTCHGNEHRFFRLWGSARARLEPGTKALAAVLPEEIMRSYTRTLAMIDARDPGASLLLRKPLAPAAGGAGHLGTDSFGRNVFQRADDPDFRIVEHWVFGANNLAH